MTEKVDQAQLLECLIDERIGALIRKDYDWYNYIGQVLMNVVQEKPSFITRADNTLDD